jgi:dihydroneopterin triphosphate diphosphatase
VVIVFAAEVDPSQEVVINEEHSEYRWLSFPEAMNLMKFDEDRQSLEICRQKLTEGSLKHN